MNLSRFQRPKFVGRYIFASPKFGGLIYAAGLRSRNTGQTGAAMDDVIFETLRQRRVTRREADVLSALQERLSNAEIAERLVLSRRTVESHVASLMRKLGAANRLELGGIALDLVARAERN